MGVTDMGVWGCWSLKSTGAIIQLISTWFSLYLPLLRFQELQFRNENIGSNGNIVYVCRIERQNMKSFQFNFHLYHQNIREISGDIAIIVHGLIPSRIDCLSAITSGSISIFYWPYILYTHNLYVLTIANILDFYSSLNLEFQESAEGTSHVVNALLLARQTTSSKYQFTTSNIC